jgi:chromosome partitioning protein
MKTVALFNNKGGVGKTSLVYHLSWMFAELGKKVLAVDLDPQSNLTSMFLEESELEKIWDRENEESETVFHIVNPILRGVGDIKNPLPLKMTSNLFLVPGHLGLSFFEDKLSDAWPRCHNRDEAAFRTMTAFHRLIRAAAGQDSDIIFIDVGPNLGAINRSALIASDTVCLPIVPDLFSLQGLANLGPALRDWRETWAELIGKAPTDLPVPDGNMRPLGYILMQHSVRDSRPVKAYQRWMDRVPVSYREDVLKEKIVDPSKLPHVYDDPFNLATLKHYRSLMPLAMEARKPMFLLKSADGAIGAHLESVHKCFEDFKMLSHRIARELGMSFNH